MVPGTSTRTERHLHIGRLLCVIRSDELAHAPIWNLPPGACASRAPRHSGVAGPVGLYESRTAVGTATVRGRRQPFAVRAGWSPAGWGSRRVRRVPGLPRPTGTSHVAPPRERAWDRGEPGRDIRADGPQSPWNERGKSLPGEDGSRWTP